MTIWGERYRRLVQRRKAKVKPAIIKLCECGCGREVKCKKSRFAKGHGRKKKTVLVRERLWKNPDVRRAVIKLCAQHKSKMPNKPERKLIALIRQYSLPFTYVGDGKKTIGGFYPDFIGNEGAKRIIEVYGTFWHGNPNATERDIKRIAAYRKQGFETLVIWEHELVAPDKVLDKIEQKWPQPQTKIRIAPPEQSTPETAPFCGVQRIVDSSSPKDNAGVPITPPPNGEKILLEVSPRALNTTKEALEHGA